MASLITSTITGNVTTTGFTTALNSTRSIRSWNTSQTGSYLWKNVFKDYWAGGTYFTTAKQYFFWIVSSNGAHYYGYQGILTTGYLVAPNGYGGNQGDIGLDWRVSNITDASSAWIGGCGANPFSAIDTSGFTYIQDACFESIDLMIKEIT